MKPGHPFQTEMLGPYTVPRQCLLSAVLCFREEGKKIFLETDSAIRDCWIVATEVKEEHHVDT
jgi:hypothetical protein